MITEDRDLLQDALGPLYESDRRKVRIDFEAGRATSRSASGLFRFYAALLFALFAVRLQCIRAETAVNRINLKLKLIERSSVYEARCTKLGVQSSVYKARCTKLGVPLLRRCFQPALSGHVSRKLPCRSIPMNHVQGKVAMQISDVEERLL